MGDDALAFGVGARALGVYERANGAVDETDDDGRDLILDARDGNLDWFLSLGGVPSFAREAPLRRPRRVPPVVASARASTASFETRSIAGDAGALAVGSA